MKDSIAIAKRTYQKDNPNYNNVMLNIKNEKHRIKELQSELALLEKVEKEWKGKED
jgi:hypothetical protein